MWCCQKTQVLHSDCLGLQDRGRRSSTVPQAMLKEWAATTWNWVFAASLPAQGVSCSTPGILRADGCWWHLPSHPYRNLLILFSSSSFTGSLRKWETDGDGHKLQVGDGRRQFSFTAEISAWDFSKAFCPATLWWQEILVLRGVGKWWKSVWFYTTGLNKACRAYW